MTKEPIFGDGKAWMSLKGLDQKLAIPDANGSMWERGRTDLPGKGTLNPADLVFDVLRLLTQGSFATIRPNTFDRISDTQCLSTHPARHYWEVRWQQAIIVNEEHIRKLLGNVTADELGNDF